MYYMMRRLIAVFLLTFAASGADIDWESATKDTFHRYLDNYNEGLEEEMIREVFAPGFVILTANEINQGKYKELLEAYVILYNDGRRLDDVESRIVMSCGNYAVESHHYKIYKHGEFVETGVTTVLLEYIDGKAMVKLSTFTPLSSSLDHDAL